MKAGANTERIVGQMYEFPEGYGRDKKRAVAALGVMTTLVSLTVLPGIVARGLVASLPDMVVPLLMSALLARVALSWPPVVVEEQFLRLKGRLVEAYKITGLDVFIPKGRPGAKAYVLRLVFTETGLKGPRPTEVRIRAKPDQARRLLAEARRVLPHASVCDRSGLLEPQAQDAGRGGSEPDQAPPPPSGPGPRAPSELRVLPEHVSTDRPRWAKDPRVARDARRGARHQERLALTARLVKVRTFRVPAVVAEWA